MRSYRVLDRIGGGAAAVVYRACHAPSGERVALKVLHPRLRGDGEARQRLRNEARAAGLIDHPGVVRVYQYGEDPDLGPFLVLELLDGEPLDRYLASRHQVPPARVVAILGPLAAALTAAHDAGVVHRDLKPANVFLLGRGAERDVRLLDFGSARFPDDPDGLSSTLAGEVLGTPRYMSPEHCQGARLVDARSDIYSLGAIAYEMLCGRPPHLGETDAVTYALQLGNAPAPPRACGAQVPRGLERAVLRALAKRPAARFARAVDFATAALVGLAQSDSGEVPLAEHADAADDDDAADDADADDTVVDAMLARPAVPPRR